MALPQNAATMWYVYILLCDQKTYYVGQTDDIDRRLAQHKHKESFFTKKFSDLQLVYTEQLSSRSSAERREVQLKKWSVAKKKALIAGDKMKLVKLSKGHKAG